MSRLAVVLAVLAGCARAPAPAPLWPALHDHDPDGGESIAPHASRAVTIAEKAEEPKPAAMAPATAAPAVAAPVVTPKDGGGGAPAVAAPAGIVDEPMMTEELLIEIDD